MTLKFNLKFEFTLNKLSARTKGVLYAFGILILRLLGWL
jgi:hypothetical protein